MYPVTGLEYVTDGIRSGISGREPERAEAWTGTRSMARMRLRIIASSSGINTHDRAGGTAASGSTEASGGTAVSGQHRSRQKARLRAGGKGNTLAKLQAAVPVRCDSGRFAMNVE